MIGLPAVQAAVPPPLRSADANHIACLLEPSVVLPIEGAPLVFSTDLAHNLILHLNTPPGAPTEPDIPLIPDAYLGGLLLQKTAPHHVELHDSKPLPKLITPTSSPAPQADTEKAATEPEPIQLTAIVQGRWGFDAFTGPTLTLQQLPGAGWHIVPSPEGLQTAELIAGHNAQLVIASAAAPASTPLPPRPTGATADIAIPYKVEPKGDQLELTLPLQSASTPGDLHLAIQQFDQPKADELATRTFSEPTHVTAIRLPPATALSRSQALTSRKSITLLLEIWCSPHIKTIPQQIACCGSRFEPTLPPRPPTPTTTSPRSSHCAMAARLPCRSWSPRRARSSCCSAKPPKLHQPRPSPCRTPRTSR